MSDSINKAVDVAILGAIGVGGYLIYTLIKDAEKAGQKAGETFDQTIGPGSTSQNPVVGVVNALLGYGYTPAMPKPIPTFVDPSGAATSYDDYIRRTGSVQEQQAWVSSSGTFKMNVESAWYASHPNMKYVNDIHAVPGYYGAAADKALEDYFGLKMSGGGAPIDWGI